MCFDRFGPTSPMRPFTGSRERRDGRSRARLVRRASRAQLRARAPLYELAYLKVREVRVAAVGWTSSEPSVRARALHLFGVTGRCARLSGRVRGAAYRTTQVRPKHCGDGACRARVVTQASRGLGIRPGRGSRRVLAAIQEVKRRFGYKSRFHGVGIPREPGKGCPCPRFRARAGLISS